MNHPMNDPQYIGIYPFGGVGYPLYVTQEQNQIVNIIIQQDYEQLDRMLTGGLDPNMRLGPTDDNRYHTCLLTLATRIANINIVQLLLNFGANPNPNTHDNPISTSVWENNADISRLLIEHPNNTLTTGCYVKLLHIIASTASTAPTVSNELIELIIEHIDTSNIDKKEYCIFSTLMSPALHVAIRRNNIIVVKYLINAGANIYLLNSMGQTALDIAHEKGFDDIVELLESSKIPVKGVYA